MLNESILSQSLKQPFRYFDSVDSTNDIAKDWLLSGTQALSVVIADEQRKGRGRKGRVWHTPAGVALALSVILKPTVHQAHRVSMLGALAVYDLCASLGIKHVGIKWANDVQIMGKKVSGILPEAVWERDKLIGVVLGIGVNVRVTFPPELAETAINLELATGQTLNREALLATLLTRIQYWYGQLDDNELFDTWEERLSTIGQAVEIEGIVGIAQGVDYDGALLIKTHDARIQRVLAGDVSLVSR